MLCVGGIRMSTTTSSGWRSRTSASSSVGVAGLTDHLETRPVQQAGQALAEQDVVIGDDDPYGRHVESFRHRDHRRSLNNLATKSQPR